MGKITRLLMIASITAILTGVAPPQDRVPFENAKKNALAQCAGKVESSSLEQLNDAWIYQFKIRRRNKKSCLISVDAKTGLIRSNEFVSGDD